MALQICRETAVLLPVLLLACHPEPTWEVSTTSSAALSGVWGTGPDNVIVVGGDDTTGTIDRWDGAAWSPMEVPDGTNLLVWAYGFGPDDIFAVGRGGSALRWDGATWSALTTGTTEDLWGVFGFAPDDVWAVGGDLNGDAPLLLHWDGAAFTEVPLDPAQNPQGATSLFKVWGTGDTLFAVGERGLILQYDGATWTNSPAGAAADDDFVSLWGTSADHIVAVGGRSGARVSTWDGAAWSTTAPSGLGGLSAVFMDDPATAYVGGIYGWVGALDVATGELTPEEILTDLDVHAMWGDGEGTVWAVGGRFMAPYEGVALLRKEGK